MKHLFKLIILILLTQSLTTASELKKVTLQLSWFNQFQFAGYFMAKEKGFYKKLGFDVEIKPFQFGIDIPKEVNNNTIDFAIGRETLILERSKNKNIVALYALFQTSPLILISTKESKINFISDFKNKKIMTTIDDASEVSLKAMITSNKVSLDDLIFLKHTHNIEDLLTKKTDVISAYISKAPFYLQKMGISYNLFDPKEYGFDMYSDLLYTSERLISKDDKVVRAFKKASLMGWEYAYSNIPESVELIHEKYNTQNFSKEELLYEAKELKKLSFYNTNVLGNIDKNKLKRIADLYNVMGLLDSQIDIDKFIYNEDINHLNFTTKHKNYLKKKKVIKVCISPKWMPYEKFDSDGNHVGISADYFKTFQRNIKIPIRVIKTDTWSQSIEFVKDRKCDILSLAIKTQDRQEYLNFTEPYFDTSYVLATKPNTAFIDNLENLRNVKVGVLKNSAFIETLQNKYPFINIVAVPNIQVGLQKVIKGEFFGFIDSFATIGYQLQTNFFGELNISGKFKEHFKLGIAVRNDDLVLLDILNSVIVNLPFDTKQKIFNKWISINYQEGIQAKTIWKYLIILSIIIIVLVLVYRQYLLKDLNKQLKREVKIEIEKNKHQNKILTEQSKLASMGEMLGNISHQWRQPLSVISMASTGIKFKSELNLLDKSELEEAMDSINNSSQYLSQTIDDFRNFLIPKNIERIEFDIYTLLDKTIKLVNSQFKSKGIKVIRKIDTNYIVSLDNEIMQVLINILNNASDILKLKIQENKLIFINSYKKNQTLYIEVIDNAGGIEDKILDKVFEPYFTTKHKSQGTGIGLYMSEEIVTKHLYGTLLVCNETYDFEGVTFKGAKFTIKIPLD